MQKKKIKKNLKKEIKQNSKNKVTKTEPLINKDFIKICPNCGSKNIDYYTDNYRRQYRCDDCSYFANEFPEVKKSEYKKDAKKIIENINNNKIKYKKKPLWITICGLLIFSFLIFVSIIILFGTFNYDNLSAIIVSEIISIVITIIIYFKYLRK